MWGGGGGGGDECVFDMVNLLDRVSERDREGECFFDLVNMLEKG